MRKILLLILLSVPCFAFAQRMELYTYRSFPYLATYAYGLPREVVKTNSEMREAQFNGDGTGVMKRHYTYKGVNERIGDKGYNANKKITFAFIVAPYNVDINGEHTSTEKLTWSQASGWDTSFDTSTSEYVDVNGVGVGESVLAAKPTGCAAYKGMHGTDKPGSWRLPTQRELQVMFTVIEQALTYIENNEVEHEIQQGLFWSSTELISTGLPQSWSMSSETGFPVYETRTNQCYARCVKDIYEPINEQ